MTLNQVINRIKLLATSHKQIRTFAQGLVTDFLADPNTKYPACFLQDNGSQISISQGSVNYSFRMFLLDQTDVSEETKQNELDIKSDMASVASDLIAQMANPGYLDWIVSRDNSLQLIVEGENDLVAGCYFDFTVRVQYTQDICQVPSALAPSQLQSTGGSGSSSNDIPGAIPKGGTDGQVLKKVGTQDYVAAWQDDVDSAAPAWGSITGLISAQTDLQTALNAKLNTSSYDWSTIPNKPTFAAVAFSGLYSDLSGTPSVVSPSRTINTTAPLGGGGDLSADRTLTISKSSSLTDGYLSAVDWNTFNGKQSALTFGSGITNTSGTVTNDFFTGKAGGLTAIGGTGASENLTLESTANATKGKIYFGSAQLSYFDEANTFFKIVNNSIGTTQTSDTGLHFANTTAAALNAQQYSPAVTWEGQGWGTTAGTSQSVIFQSWVKPVQSTVPTGEWHLQYSIAGGAFADAMYVTSAGRISLPSTGILYINGTTSPAQDAYIQNWNLNGNAGEFILKPVGTATSQIAGFWVGAANTASSVARIGLVHPNGFGYYGGMSMTNGQTNFELGNFGSVSVANLRLWAAGAVAGTLSSGGFVATGYVQSNTGVFQSQSGFSASLTTAGSQGVSINGAVKASTSITHGNKSNFATHSAWEDSSNNIIATMDRTGIFSIGGNAVSGTGYVQFRAGASTQNAKAGGAIFDHFVDAGNSTTTETDLFSDTIAASTLNTNGDGIRAQYGGVTVAHATNTRRIRVYFGGTVILDTGAVTTTSAANWFIDVTIIRDTSTSVRCIATLSDNNTSNLRTSLYSTVTALTLTNTQILKVTGQSSSSTNDIVAKLSKVEFLSAA